MAISRSVSGRVSFPASNQPPGPLAGRLALWTLRSLAAAWCLLSQLATPTAVRGDEVSPEAAEFFEKQIRPLLVERCGECHGGEHREGGLSLSTRDSLLKGGETGPAVAPGAPDDSLLIRAVEYLHEPKMPPSGKLPDAEVERLKRWVAMGAPWPQATAAAAPTATDPDFRPSAAQRAWWAFQPPQEQTPPEVRDAAWPQNEIDRFILAALEARGLRPAPPADRRTWLRRATFDLTGLPPTPEDVDAFVTDNSPHAMVRAVDRLLVSTAYGQRWARHWLDVARYADYHDGDAKVRDPTCEPLNAWRYRDWVVDAFNRDLPFDQFIVHQIAGDLLPDPQGGEFYADGLVATTFLSNGVWDRGDADKEKMVSDMVDDHIDTVGKAFLGLTLGCARCHDHKFDPVSQRDYYGLAGIFYSTRILKELGAKGGNYTLLRIPLAPSADVAQRDAQLAQIAEIDAKLKALDEQSPKPADDDPRRVALMTERDALRRTLLPEPPLAEAAIDGGTPGGLFPGIQDVPIHIRGSYTRLGEVVPRRLPAFFAGTEQPPISSGSGRRELAHWVASPDNPLTARVIVNRVWQWHFGAGLVRTPNNFGLLSQPPSHPELLDWLALRFIEDGWSLKQLHRRIMLSATYAQSAAASRALLVQDPENVWLGRFVPRRLEAEEIRDAMLAAAGPLDLTPGGPASDDLAVSRRSLYVQTARWDRSSFAMLFDAANPDASEERRNVSTVAPQALFLLNNPFVHAQAARLAERLIREIPDEAADCQTLRLQRAYRLLFQRLPTDAEVAVAADVLAFSAGEDPQAGWAELSHVLLCSNEFVYLD